VKALVIAPQPFFSPRGTPFSVYYRTLVTAELGVQVDLLTYGEGQDVEIENVRIIRIPRFGFLGNVKVGPSLLKAFLDMFIILWTIALLVRNRYDYVHAHEEAIFFCLFLKPLFRFKLVYDMHSSLPQQLTNFRFTTSRILIGAFRRLERMSLRASNAVITICPDLADYALSEIDDPSKHVLIENSIFDPVRLSEPAQPVRTTESESGMVDLPQGRPLIVYAGTLEPYQGIDLLLQAFRSVLKHIPEAFLLVVGGNPHVARTRR
jgi:glycosyltransferase involved in cell wall biosynthesis